MAENPEVLYPVIRFEYRFDAEVIDPELRRAFAGDRSSTAPGSLFLQDIRQRLEQALTATPGLLVGRVGLSELGTRGAAELFTENPEFIRDGKGCD